jgi:hypothetical protein
MKEPLNDLHLRQRGVRSTQTDLSRAEASHLQGSTASPLRPEQTHEAQSGVR